MPTSTETKPNGTKSATAKRGAKQQPEPEHPRAETRRLRTSFEPLELTPLQETAIDLCADLIIHGGNRDDAYDVFRAALSHYHRRRFQDHLGGPEKYEKALEEFLEIRLPEWEVDIQAAWKRNPRAEMKDPAENANAVTATAKARVHARRELIGYLEDFANEASGEEARLMHDVLTTWDGVNSPSVWGYPDIALAEAFATEIGERAEYIRVPTRLTDQVRRFVEALSAIENSPKAA